MTRLLWRALGLVGALLAALPAVVRAQASAAEPAASPPARILPADVGPLLRPVPLILDRLRPSDIGLVINVRDPFSVAVGAYYAARRGLSPEQILRVELPTTPSLTPREFQQLQQAIDDHFGYRAQALALAWTAPYAVQCNSLNGALAMGFDPTLCENSCGHSRPSAYANSRSSRPYSELRMRLSMHLAARSVDEAKALIDRGIRSDGSLTRPGAPTAEVLLVTTADGPRNVRSNLYPPERSRPAHGVTLRRVSGLAAAGSSQAILLSVGAADLGGLPEIGWLPGALADHLTSFGGDLLGQHGQATALQWISAGATASHGAVSEPCNHLHKFPHPVWLMGHYLQGATALEAYWKSVLWPQQSLFVGEPLAAPFASTAPRR